jgi:hypothetical protein
LSSFGEKQVKEKLESMRVQWFELNNLEPAPPARVFLKDPLDPDGDEFDDIWPTHRGANKAFDHFSYWRQRNMGFSKSRTATVLIVHVYYPTAEILNVWCEFAKVRDLKLQIVDGSFWNPGHTVMAAFIREGGPDIIYGLCADI